MRAEDAVEAVPQRDALPARVGQQAALREGVVDHVEADRVPFVVVAVEQAGRRPALDVGRQFPGQVGGVLQAEVEALAAGRVVDVRGVAGQQHPAGPVAGRLPGRVAHPAQPVAGDSRRPKSVPGDAQRARPQILERDRPVGLVGSVAWSMTATRYRPPPIATR